MYNQLQQTKRPIEPLFDFPGNQSIAQAPEPKKGCRIAPLQVPEQNVFHNVQNDQGDIYNKEASKIQ